ncbi:MAG: anti-sigma factor [Thermomicrobiales bacterium]
MDEQMIERAMQPIDDGMLRAYLDGDPVLDDAARGRIAAALVEQSTLAERLIVLRADATAVEAAFAPLAMPEPDAAHRERAYRRVQTRLTTERHTRFLTTIKERITDMTNINRDARVRRFAFAGSLGALALVLLLVFAPVTDAFTAVLNTFRYQPTQFAVITLNTSQFPQFQGKAAKETPGAKPVTGSKPSGTPTAQDQQKLMQELSKYVSFTSSVGQGQLPGRSVASAADAKAAVGRDVTAPTYLPPGVANTPQYFVSDHQTADATLHLNEIRPALTQVGMGSLIPATGDSATVHLDAPGGVIISYGFNPAATGDAAKNQKGVAVIAMGSPTIDVTGLDVQGIVTAISALPNMPPEFVAQLKSADLQHTLIIPVTDQQVVKNGTIKGARSTTISQKDGSMSVVLWITSDNVLHIAVGTFDGPTMEKVAASA